MKTHKIFWTALSAVFLILTFGVMGEKTPATAASHESSPIGGVSKITKVVVQVSANDPKRWNLALNNAENVQEDLGKANVDISIVAYGPGLPMLELQSVAANRISNAIARGVKVIACENTMRKDKLTRQDMLPNLDYTISGVVYLVQKQGQGYAYIKP